MEYELLDTVGVFKEEPLFRCLCGICQGRTGRHPGPESPAGNRGPEAAELHILPTLWFRNNGHRGLHNSIGLRETRDGSRSQQSRA